MGAGGVECPENAFSRLGDQELLARNRNLLHSADFHLGGLASGIGFSRCKCAFGGRTKANGGQASRDQQQRFAPREVKVGWRVYGLPRKIACLTSAIALVTSMPRGQASV